MLSDEKRNLETRLNHAESELNVCEMTKEHLRNDKTIVSIKCVLIFFSENNFDIKNKFKDIDLILKYKVEWRT